MQPRKRYSPKRDALLQVTKRGLRQSQSAELTSADIVVQQRVAILTTFTSEPVQTTREAHFLPDHSCEAERQNNTQRVLWKLFGKPC